MNVGKILNWKKSKGFVPGASEVFYLPRGEYQLVVESIEPLGVGALQKAFEQL